MKIDVKVDLDNCKFDTDTLHKRISEALEYGAENVKRTATELAPERTGDLKNSIHVTGNNWLFHIQPGTPPYDLYIEEGTRPHTITGNYWLYWEGCDHPVHEVNHPGNAAYKYMEEAMEANVEGLVELIEEAIGDVFL